MALQFNISNIGSRVRPRSAVVSQSLDGKLLKPKKTYFSNEDILESFKAAKLQLNQVKEENLKLRTRVKYLEKGLVKNDKKSGNQSKNNFKDQIKDLQKHLIAKEKEISDLKIKNKNSRLNELEIEVKVFSDECIRLQKLLKEAYLQLSQGLTPIETQERFIKQSLQLRALNKEYKQLLGISKLEKMPEERNKPVFFKLKKKLLRTKEEYFKVIEDNQNLINEIHYLNKNPQCKKCGFIQNNENKDIKVIISDIWQAIEHKRLSLEDIWETIDPYSDQTDKITFSKGLEKLRIFLTSSELNFFVPDSNIITESLFTELMEKYKPADLTTFDDVREIITHISFRLQIMRFEYSEISSIFFPDDCTYTPLEFSNSLQGEPVELTKSFSEDFSKFLFGRNNKLSGKECSARLCQIIDPWKVLNEVEEKIFDMKLKEIVLRLGKDFKKSLEVYDKEDDGYVNIHRFFEAFKERDVDLSDPMKRYLQLLFYTDKKELNIAPYKNFYKAYSKII